MKNYLLILFALCLNGCDSTTFESPPGKDIRQCDERWVGNWEIVYAEGEDLSKKNQADDEKGFLVVDQDCKSFKSVEKGEIKEEEDFKKSKPVFAKVQDKDLVVLTLSENESKGKEKSGKRGYLYVAYKMKKDEVSVFDINHEYVNQLIEQQDLKGTTEKHGEKTPYVENFLIGNSRKMAKIIKTKQLFNEKPLFVMKKIDRLPEFPAKSESELEK